MRWTSTGRMGLPAWRDRVEEGERTIEEAGGKLVGVWVTLGQYDVVEVFEAPDDETALEIMASVRAYFQGASPRSSCFLGVYRGLISFFGSGASAFYRQRADGY